MWTLDSVRPVAVSHSLILHNAVELLVVIFSASVMGKDRVTA